MIFLVHILFSSYEPVKVCRIDMDDPVVGSKIAQNSGHMVCKRSLWMELDEIGENANRGKF